MIASDLKDRAYELARAINSRYCTTDTDVTVNEVAMKIMDFHNTQLVAGSDMVLRCAFCGEAYLDGTPTHKSDALAAHIRVCVEHPIGKENRALKEQLKRAAPAVGHIRSILETKDREGVDIEIGSTALKSLIRWAQECNDALNSKAST